MKRLLPVLATAAVAVVVVAAVKLLEDAEPPPPLKGSWVLADPDTPT